MRFGLALPHYGFSLDGEPDASFAAVAGVARRAEALGFDSVWISDHFFLSLARYGGDARLHGSLEPLTTLAALAAVTERVRLGTLVLCAPFRHPAILAKTASTVDLASGGRLDLGIGSGWYEEEFRAFGYPFEPTGSRFDQLEEQLLVLRAMFDEGPADHEGTRYRLRGAYNRPRPVQGAGPPIWLGSKGGPRSLRMAARFADGWNTVWRWAPEAYAERAAEAGRICEAEGRDPATLRRSVGLLSIVGEDPEDLRSRFERIRQWLPGALDETSPEAFVGETLSGTPEGVRERVAVFEELGVEEIVVSPASVPFALPDPTMLDVLAEGVLSPLRSAR
jgi:probable F420-dependent oxidoreductase